MPTLTGLEDVDPFAYRAAPLENSDTAIAPRYDDALDWMRDLAGRAASLDFWARGNYARRLIANTRHGVTPLLIPVQALAEIRWAYNRLALLGLPVEFLWQGDLSRPQKIVHLHPGAPEDHWDAGWGYIATLASCTLRRRTWCPVIGFARLMPEEVANWIVDEVPEAFQRGDVFVTPAELVGVSSQLKESAEAFKMLTSAVPFRSDAAAEVLLSIELPVLDCLRPRQVAKLLADHAIETERLRVAFRKLVGSTGGADLDECVKELNYETSELTLADRYHGFRSNVSRLGGVVATSAAAIGAVVGAASGNLVTALLASAGGVATAGLCECLRERAEHGLELRRNPLFLLWQLGAQKGTRFRRTEPARHRFQQRKVAAIGEGQDGYFHWLAPPTAGIQFAFVREKK
jgi:hypothetical protein